MTNYTHLNKEQRSNLEYLINLNKNFTYIGKSIKVDRTTISKEIKLAKHKFNVYIRQKPFLF